MVDQIEFADVVVLNKVDAVDRKIRTRVKELISKLNNRAKVLECSYGRVEVQEIVNTGRFSLEIAQTGYGWLQDLHAMTVREVNGKNAVTPKPETEEYDVCNFVYVRHRPFHPERLFVSLHGKFILQHPPVEEESVKSDDSMEADEDDADGSDGTDANSTTSSALDIPDPTVVLANKRAHALFARLFRSKGEFWLATRPYRAGEWSQTGAMLTLSGGRPWFCCIQREEWESGQRDIDAMVEHGIAKGGEVGDRRQEIVFIHWREA